MASTWIQAFLKNFFNALDRCFPKGHKYNKIFNRHTIKLSYSTTPNITRIIAGFNGSKLNRINNNGPNDNNFAYTNNNSNNSNNLPNIYTSNSNITSSTQNTIPHNTTSLTIDNNIDGSTSVFNNTPSSNISSNLNANNSQSRVLQSTTCNCRVPNSCPVNNKCLTKDVIYTAIVHSGIDTSNPKIHKYIGATSTTFKNRFSNHIHSFKHKKLRFSTSLSNLVHDLKDKNNKFTIDWKLTKKANSYKLGNRSCDLCLSEALFILKNKPDLINKHDETIIRCNHLMNKTFVRYKT